MNIQQLARQYADKFTTGYRDKDQEKPYLYIEEKDEDENLSKLIYDAHNGMIPDDYKYQFIYEALEAIAETDSPDEIQLEPDCYTYSLLQWLSSHLDRVGYCDDVLENLGNPPSFINIVGEAQYYEKREVLDSVLSTLNDLVEDLNDEKINDEN